MKIIVRDRQNIFDIALQYFGNMSFASTIIRDNGLRWSAPISDGDELTVNNEGVGNAEIKNFFLLKKGFVQNGALVLISNDPPYTFDNTLITWDSTVVTWDQT
jgi:hypothetical protein